MAGREKNRPPASRRGPQGHADQPLLVQHRPRLEGLHPFRSTRPAEKLLGHADGGQIGDDAKMAGDARMAMVENSAAIDQQ